MSKNLTMEELNTLDARTLICIFLNERRNKLTNQEAPLAIRLKELVTYVEAKIPVGEFAPGRYVEYEMEKKKKRLKREAKRAAEE